MSGEVAFGKTKERIVNVLEQSLLLSIALTSLPILSSSSNVLSLKTTECLAHKTY